MCETTGPVSYPISYLNLFCFNNAGVNVEYFSRTKKKKRALLMDLVEIPERDDRFSKISYDRMKEIRENPKSVSREEVNTISLYSSLLRLEKTKDVESMLEDEELDEDYIKKRFSEDLPENTYRVFDRAEHYLDKGEEEAFELIGHLMHTRNEEETRKEMERIENIVSGDGEGKSYLEASIMIQSFQ